MKGKPRINHNKVMIRDYIRLFRFRLYKVTRK